MADNQEHRWFPVASSDDLQMRHVFHGQLLGREMAIWRADDGFVNIWENRCLHRGVRLSIGINDGRELKCQYHGWRYSSRSAGCTYIPAHPADAPARRIQNKTFPAIERYGLVWSCLEKITDLEEHAVLRGRNIATLRSIPVNAPADLVLNHFAALTFAIPSGTTMEMSAYNDQDHMLVFNTDLGDLLTVFVQPIDANRSVIRAVIDAQVPDARLAVLQHYDTVFCTVRDEVERQAERLPRREERTPIYSRVSKELASLPEQFADNTLLRVTVKRKWEAAQGVAGFEFAPIDGSLPVAQPGAHLDVTTPQGLTRQYSIVNGPGEGDGYTIGVKLEPDSSGGSKAMHETVWPGDVLAISAPHNNFPLRRDAMQTIFIAGGIGITPLLSMAQTFKHLKLPFDLHYFAQTEDHLAFPERLKTLGDNLHLYLGLTPDDTGAHIRDLLADRDHGAQVYICGPGGMLTATREMAMELGWPDEDVHFEYFKNTTELNTSSSFEIALARSGLTLEVPSGKSILEVLRDNGVGTPSSCEQGACGTCLATVIEGDPDHQDVFLSDTEKAGGKKIMTCVSRSKSKRLILDL